jgi:hypothetical protein
MGWTLGSRDLRLDLLQHRQSAPVPGDESASESTCPISYRESAADPNTDNYGLDLSASVRRCVPDPRNPEHGPPLISGRRVGAVMDDPTAAKVALVCLRPIPKLNRGAWWRRPVRQNARPIRTGATGTPEKPQRLVLGLDWTDAHTPMRAKVNVARSRGNAARYLDISEMTRDTAVDFSAMMCVPTLGHPGSL